MEWRMTWLFSNSFALRIQNDSPRLDAFCYLIGKMSGQGKANKGDSSKDISPLCHGEFTGSISEPCQ